MRADLREGKPRPAYFFIQSFFPFGTYVCLSTVLSVRLSVYLSVCLSVLSVYLSVCVLI